MTIKTFFYKFIILGLTLNSFIIYAQNIIYVNGTASNSGDGSKQNPYKSFKTALNSAQDRDIIKILGKATERYGENGNPNQDSSGEVRPFIINKEITIESENNSTLEFIGLYLSTSKDITFKNLRLSLIPLTNLVDAFAGTSKNNSYIFANGNKVVFNNVTTKIENGNNDTRPTIIAGTYKDTPDAGRAEIIIENSPSNGDGRLKAIIAGNTNSPKNTPTTITLDRNARVDEVFFGGVENSVTAKVTVKSKSNYIRKYNANNSNDNLLELTGYTASYTPTFTNIKDLSLKSSTLFNLPPTVINRKLTMDNSSRISFIEPDPDGFYYANISINQLESEGGTITLPDNIKMTIEGKASGTLNLEINQGRFSDGKEIIEANENSNIEITLTSLPSNFSLIRTSQDGRAIWRIIDKSSIKISPVTNPQISFNDNTKTINVSWQKPNNTTGLTGYEIQRDGQVIQAISSANTLSFSEQISANGNYTYSIYAVYSDQKSGAVNVNIEVSSIITPSPVNNPQINFDNNTKTINVSWQKPDNLNGLTGYEIYEKGSKIHTINNVDELSFSKPITTNGTYSYDIYAIYSTQKSGAVNVNIEVSSIITPSPVNSPNITFEEATKTLKITWLKPDNLNGLTGYEIYEGSNKIHSTTSIDELSFSKSITTNGTYTYDIFAIYSTQKSTSKQVSIEVNTIPTTPAPTPPTNDTGTTIGRVGINTREPKATLDIRETDLNALPAGTPQGVSFPNFTTTQRDTFDKLRLKEGTMIYNTTSKCLEFYNGTDWVCIQIKNN